MPYRFSSVGFRPRRGPRAAPPPTTDLAHAFDLREHLRHHGGRGVVHLAFVSDDDVSDRIKMGESEGFTFR